MRSHLSDPASTIIAEDPPFVDDPMELAVEAPRLDTPGVRSYTIHFTAHFTAAWHTVLRRQRENGGFPDSRWPSWFMHCAVVRKRRQVPAARAPQAARVWSTRLGSYPSDCPGTV